MPLRNPRPNEETQSEWCDYCIPYVLGDGSAESQDQAVAICLRIWEQAVTGKTSASGGVTGSAIVHKQHVTVQNLDELEFVLSDATVDRYGDVIEPAGWKLANFKSNPIALFGHDSTFPIGIWENIRVQGGKLIAKLAPAMAGTSLRIDEIRRLLEQKILRTTSVGFKPLKAEPRDEGRGVRFIEQELLECSVVSVPANPSAVQLAKSLGISSETMDLVFGKEAIRTRSVQTGQAGQSTNSHQSGSKMTISERIVAARQRLVALQTELRGHIENMAETPDDAALTRTEELNTDIETTQRHLEQLESAERRLAGSATGAGEGGGERREGGEGTERRTSLIPAGAAAGGNNFSPADRVWASSGKKVDPADHVYRSLAVLIKHHDAPNGTPLAETLKSMYGEGQDALKTKTVLDVQTKAATTPATTTGVGWATELIQIAYGEFIDALMPESIYPGLSAIGGRFTFGQNGIVSLPARSSTPTVAGSFVAQGAPIPVRQAGFTAIQLTIKKMGVITTMTREITEHSTPAIEGILRQAIQEDTGVAVDTVLLDANAATAIRPAGLLNGVTKTAPTAGGGFNALVGDLKALMGALIAATAGRIRNPVWVMNPVQELSISLTQNANGMFPFGAEIAAGNLRGFPVLDSTVVPAGTILLVDAADFFSATGDVPRFDVSDQAVLHMEDTAPTALGTTGTPNVTAAPVRSLWQTDTLGLRMIMEINWAMRRGGSVVWTDTVTW